MTREKIQQHIVFLRKVMSNVSGMSGASIHGKNQGIRDAASRKLEDSTREVERYLGNNQDLFDFIVEVEGCGADFLDYPTSAHIERETSYYIDSLEEALENAPE